MLLDLGIHRCAKFKIETAFQEIKMEKLNIKCCNDLHKGIEGRYVCMFPKMVLGIIYDYAKLDKSSFSNKVKYIFVRGSCEYLLYCI